MNHYHVQEWRNGQWSVFGSRGDVSAAAELLRGGSVWKRGRWWMLQGARRMRDDG